MDWSVIINFSLIVLIILGLIGFLFYRLRRIPQQQTMTVKKKNLNLDKFELNKIQDFVAEEINKLLSVNLLDLGLSTEEYARRKANLAELQNALRNANAGDLREKIYVKQHIRDILTMKYEINPETIDYVIPFNDKDALKAQDKFEILLYVFKKKYGYKALHKLIETYRLDEGKYVIEDGTVESYIITKDEIETIFEKEANSRLTFEDKLQIIVQRIYQEYKGHGVIDEIRDMNIDGVSGGVSSLPENMQFIDDEIELMNAMKEEKKDGYNSVWIFYKGKSIHLSFLSFESEHELKRICQNIYKYDNPGQLTESNGYIVNDMKDGSRVVVVRPPFNESWAFWIRKFDLPNMTLEKLFPDEGNNNAELPRGMIKYLMKGGRTTAFTGPQGAGKTSVLMASIKYISATFNLRIQELAFELHLRRLYPERNTSSFRETDTISGQESLDVQKKTDGTVSIIGEISTDEVASWAVKTGTVASKFTVFTAHPKTFADLIEYMRNALVNKKYFSDQHSAEEQVAKVIEMDVHLEKSNTGVRYIERITESMFNDSSEEDEKLKEIADLAKEPGIEGKLNALITLQLEGLRRKTAKRWKAHNLIEYQNGVYVAKNPPSEEKIRLMLSVMSPTDGNSFKAFLKKHWGLNYE